MKKLSIILTTLLTLLLFAGCSHQSAKYELFHKLLATSDSSLRMELSDSIIKKFPGSEEAEYCLALLPDSSNNYERIRHLNAAIRMNPEFAQAYNLRGQVKTEMGFYRFALADFINASQLDKNYAEAFYNKANLFRIYRYMPEAMGAYDTAIMLRPNFAEAWLNRGVANELMQKNKEALADFSKALELNPSNAEIWLDRGIVKGKLKDYKGSLEDLRKAIQLRPDYGKAWQNKGITEYMAGMADSACASWNKAAAMGVEDAGKALEKYCR